MFDISNVGESTLTSHMKGKQLFLDPTILGTNNFRYQQFLDPKAVILVKVEV